MENNISNNIILTGAGFTKNFGGLLGNEMWSKIFNYPDVQNESKLKEMITQDPDYESIYHKVVKGGEPLTTVSNYNKVEKKAINEAIFNAYQDLDIISRQWKGRNSNIFRVDMMRLSKFIERFAGTSKELGFFFTLNQDLFIERNYFGNKFKVIHPLVKKQIPDPHIKINNLSITKDDFAPLPTENEVNEKKENPLSEKFLNYIKLHGSFGWLSSEGENSYVIGKEKEKDVAEEPLLHYYFDLFKNVLAKPKRRLLIIGYGFRDDHINEVIANSVENSGLKIYVIKPSNPEKFIGDLKSINKVGRILFKGLSGFYPYYLKELFPADGTKSHALKEIERNYYTN